MNHQTATTTGQETFCLVCSSRHHDAPNCSFVEQTNKPKPQTKNPKPSKP